MRVVYGAFGGPDNGRTGRRPRIDVGSAADEVFLLDVADLTEVLGDHLVIGGTERIGIDGHRERPDDVRDRR